MPKIHDHNRERMYLNWGLVYSLWLVIISYPIAWILQQPIRVGRGNTLNSIVGIYPPVNIIIAVLMPFMLYYMFKKVDAQIPGMNKFSLVVYFLIGIFFAQTVILSVLNWSFMFGKVGLIHIGIAFLGTKLYITKNTKYNRKERKLETAAD